MTALWQTCEIAPGEYLVEASAGTGKTFTLSHLWLRFVILKQPELKHVVAVTFTKAAAQELRIRFRALVESLMNDALSESQSSECLTYFLSHDLSTQEIGRRARHVLEQFHHLQISTIHRFARSVLNRIDKAHSAISAYTERQPLSASQLIHRCLGHYRRLHLDQLQTKSPDAFDILQEGWLHPSALRQLARSIFESPDLIVQEADETDSSFQKLDQLMFAYRDLHSILQEQQEHIVQVFRTLHAQGVICRRKYKKTSIEQLEQTLSTHLQHQPSLHQLFDMHDALARFMILSREGALKETCPPEARTSFESLEQIKAYSNQAAAAINAIGVSQRIQFIHFCQTELEQARLTFDPALFSLWLVDALATIEQQTKEGIAPYQLILVDEFQDSDALQAGLFESLSRYSGVTTYYVGDPKQAIYAFRNANINTYLSVKNRVPTVYQLDTNWRSAPQLVEHLNQLYQADAQLFARADLTAYTLKAGQPDMKSPLCGLYRLESDLTIKTKEARLAHRVRQFLDILNQSSIAIDDYSIAILVHNNQQIQQTARILKAHHWPTYAPTMLGKHYMRDRVLDLLSVLSTHQINAQRVIAILAGHWNWLQHQNAPHVQADIEHLVYRWQSQPTSQQYIQTLLFDFESTLIRLDVHLDRYHQFLQDIMSLDIFAEGRYCTYRDVQRLLENDVFVETIFSQESGPHAFEPLDGHINCMTIHKSKGLEFDFVFCPTLFDFSLRTPKPPPHIRHFHAKDNIFTYPAAGEIKRHLYVGDTQHPHAFNAAYQEGLEESCRKSYVAITRAKYATIVSSSEHVIDTPLYKQVQSVARKLEQTASLDCDCRGQNKPVKHQPISKRKRLNFPASTFSTTSFSAIKSNIQSAIVEKTEAPDVIREEHQSSLQQTPRGAEWGRYIHGLLEHLPDFAMTYKDLEAFIVCHDSDFGLDIKKLASQHIFTLLNTPFALNDRLLQFSQLPMNRLYREWHFDIQLTAKDCVLAPDDIREILETYISTGNTYITGEIDLIIQQADGFAIIDYKTNDLGELSAYCSPMLEQHVRAQHYHLQGWLYGLALHKHLQHMQPSADIAPIRTAFLFTRRAFFEATKQNPQLGLFEQDFITSSHTSTHHT